MAERKNFLDAIEEDPHDRTVRLIYADWLDERGEYEEALRQRNYLPSLVWLEEFVNENNPQNPEEDYECTIDFGTLLEQAREVIEGRADVIYCGNNETMCNALRTNSAEFWEAVSVITGLPPKEGDDDIGWFRCAC